MPDDKFDNQNRALQTASEDDAEILYTTKLYERIQTPDETREASAISKRVDHSDGELTELTAAGVAVLENEGKVRVGIRRLGGLDCEIKVRMETINGIALAGEDYTPFNEVVTFEKTETLKSVFIEIVDDVEWEPDEFFFVILHLDDLNSEASLVSNPICQITIINDDEK